MIQTHLPDASGLEKRAFVELAAIFTICTLNTITKALYSSPMHQSSTRFVFVFVFFCAQVSLYGQVKEIEAAVKQIDTDVMAMLKLKPSDTISVPGTDADIIAAGAIHPDISGFFYDGKLQRIDAKYMGDAGKRWLISYYFSGDSLIYLNSEYAEALINIDDDFYVVQYRNAHYFKNGAPFYRNAEGSAAKALEAYKDPLTMQRYAEAYFALLVKRKK